MDREQLLDMFRARLSAPPPPPLEATRTFLSGYLEDAHTLDEVRQHARRMAGINTRTLEQGLAGIEGLLDDPPPPGTLARLVANEGNWVLEDPTSDAAATAFLRPLADLLRDVLHRQTLG
jgi:hypothetical protein